ncbi:flagellar motor protein MotB [Clostridium estertheticum]|uniref:flagellar motor protein MotB n=1 Tax=Clostridium estertheticum TaxID=238834 RepID=UPI001CF27E36|nr:flagellar motor protein MotB [Clostridium estertheticum]MCB2356674.1 OmpA family protein [Clostridium estertheticum]WAG42797.1 OmpA family protein [Clostridium estertheticum]
MSRRKKIRPEIRTDTWLATFADTMTLLLTFFVVLYSFSTVDATKFKQVASSFQSVLTGETTKSSLNFNVKDGDVPLVGLPLQSGAAGSDTQSIYKKVQSFIKNKELESIVEIKTDNRGVIIQLRENIIFESGNAEIIDKSKSVLNSINALISTFPNDIVIEGHTDNEPISNSKYKNNWQLSSDRALQVLEYFVVTKGQARPNRFKSVACGEYQPIAANNSDANRALNRRVNILIVANDKEAITK